MNLDRLEVYHVWTYENPPGEALKNPCSFARSCRDTASVRQGNQWIGKMPVLNVDDYVFGYANITYDTTIVRSTEFNAAIPAKLGSAKATDTVWHLCRPPSSTSDLLVTLVCKTFLQLRPYKLRGVFFDVSPCVPRKRAGLAAETWCHAMSI
jgi:hypothetical protein